MYILLTNDDGFDSRYLMMLSEAASARGHHVTVCAPHSQQSGKSHSITYTPLICHERTMPGADAAFSIEGTPADAAHVGVCMLCETRPDIVISGMNFGWNIGTSTFLSGTIGAAREAAFSGLPALAVSISNNTPEETARWFAEQAIIIGEKLIKRPLPPLSVCSINCPGIPLDEIKPMRLANLGTTQWLDNYREVAVPRRGLRYFIMDGCEERRDCTPGTDQALLEEGHTTMTVLTSSAGPQDGYEYLL